MGIRLTIVVPNLSQRNNGLVVLIKDVVGVQELVVQKSNKDSRMRNSKFPKSVCMHARILGQATGKSLYVFLGHTQG